MNKTAAIVIGVSLALGGVWLWRGQSGNHGSTWPQKPVRLILGIGSGGSLDLTARLIGEKLGQHWGQSVIVDNRPGGEGLIAATAFANARDDHTLFFGPSAAITLFPETHKQLPYDPDRDFIPISIATEPRIVIAATASFPATTLAELVQLVREKPGVYVWTAVPSVPEMLFAAIVKKEKLEMKHAAYREFAMGLQDLVQGRIQIIVCAMPAVEPHVRAGRARLLAVATTTRADAAPDTPTLAEAGYPALTVDGSFGFYGYRGMSDNLRNQIAADVRTVIAEPQLAARLLSMGQTPRTCTPEEYSAIHDRQRQQFGSLVRLLEMEPE